MLAIFSNEIKDYFWRFFGLRPFFILCIPYFHWAFDFVGIASRLDFIRPGLVQGGKAPNVVG